MTRHGSPAAPRATIVADLGFGDSGKGTITDFLVREEGARLVVRWNGGAQAGHTVVTDDGRSHVFSQLGAGTFVPGVRTHLAETVVIHPTALLVEARHLREKGVPDALERLTVAASARVTTPFHQAAGRIRELRRGAERHGTCGVGVGETVRDALDAKTDTLCAADLRAPVLLAAKLTRLRERVRASLAWASADDSDDIRAERAVLDDEGALADRWIALARTLATNVVPDDALGAMLREGPCVLEGAQGALLDEALGFHPHTTWSDCTARAAARLLERHGHTGQIVRLGVVRTYATRHGEGPLPSEDAALRTTLDEPHNQGGSWQGSFRVGHLDLVLLRHALVGSGGVDALSVTHCDRGALLSSLVTAYDGAPDPTLFTHDARGRAIALRAGDLEHQERLGRALRSVRPVHEAVGSPEALPARIADALGVRLSVTSHGPRASDKRRHR